MSSLFPRLTNRLHYLPVVLLSTYILFLALILHPQIQAHNVFLHYINFPFHLDLSSPEKIKSLPSGRVRNFQIEAIDGVCISGWHLLPNDFNQSQDGDTFDRALQQKPTLIYFHGNAMNRAAPFRIQAYAQFTALNVNLVAIDYRGFGDSKGTPSEAGLQRDARATYKWVQQRQQSESEIDTPAILITGHSLGTGVAARLALDLFRVGHPLKGLFLIAPYTSIANLLTSYKIGGFLPIFWPLGLWKVLSDLADKHLYTRFESEKALYQMMKGGPDTLDKDEWKQFGNLDHTLTQADLSQELGVSSAPLDSTYRPPHIIISHADNDAVIPHTHGKSLLDIIALALGETQQNIDEVEYHWGKTLTIPDAKHLRKYALIKSYKGGHNGVPQHAVDMFSKLVGLD